VRIRVGSEEGVCQASEAGSRKSINGWRGQIICPSHRDMCGHPDDMGPNPRVPCAFPGVLRHDRCVCAPGYLGLDCTKHDSGSERSHIPLGLEYPQSELDLSVGVSLAQSTIGAWPFRPTLLNAPAQVIFSVAPPLPPGLHLSSNDGTLSGTPTVQVPKTAYTVLARVARGGTATTLYISVVGSGAPHATLAPARTSSTTPRSNGAVGNGSVGNTVGGQTSDCYTVTSEGVGKGQRCIFPFVYNGVEHFTCAKDGSGTLWCPTQVNHARVPVRGRTGNCQCNGGNSGGSELVLVLSETFRNIQANPGLEAFQTVFADAMSASLQWSVGVRSLKKTTSGQLAVIFCAPTPFCSSVGDSAFAVTLDVLCKELQSTGSPLRISSFGRRYLPGVQLFTRSEAGGLSKVWPSDGTGGAQNGKPESDDNSSWWSFITSYDYWVLALAGSVGLAIVVMITCSLRSRLRRGDASAQASGPGGTAQSSLPGGPTSQRTPRPVVVGIATPVPPMTNLPLPASATGSHSQDDAVLRMMDMGYDFQLSVSALQDNNWSIERAVQALTHPSIRSITASET